MKNSNQSGFTLVEIIVVIADLGYSKRFHPDGGKFLLKIIKGPDVMVAPDEVDSGPRIADPVQALKDGIITPQAEMGIIEPEIEDVSEQDQMVRLGGKFEQFQEPGHALALGLVGMQMKMGVGHDDGRGLFQIIHAA